MKSRVRRIGALIIGVLIASVLLISLHQLSGTTTAEHTGIGNTHGPSFDPESSIELSSTTPGGASCEPGCNPTHTTTFNLISPDTNFGPSGAALVTFFPGQWCFATHSNDCSTVDGSNNPTGPAVPVGAIVGDVDSDTTLALQPIPPSTSGFNTACNQTFPVEFPTFVEAVPNDGAGGGGPTEFPYDTTGTIAPGTGGDNLAVMNQDANNNGIIDGADKFPTFVSEMSDPDGDGPKRPTFPIARYVGDQIVQGTEVFLQTLIYAPGTFSDSTLGFPGAPWDSFGISDGYQVLTILQNPLEFNLSTIGHFCTTLLSKTTTLGITLVNNTSGTKCRLCTATASISVTRTLHRNGSATGGIGDSGTYIYRLTGQGGRDFEAGGGDSYETAFDTCATKNNLDGDPRTTISLGADFDSLDAACDPFPLVKNLDEDGDGVSNIQDNAPLCFNPAQLDADISPGTAVPDGGSPTDDFGDICEPDYDDDGNSPLTFNCASPGAGDDIDECGLDPTIANGGYLDALVKSFACNGAADGDGDGWCDARETFTGTLINDACSLGGDVAVPVDNNDDGAVNIQDRARVVSEILAGTNGARFDLNSDGFVNILDRAATVASNGWQCSF